MTENELLSKIEAAAKKADIQAALYAANEETPFDFLTLYFGNDDQNRVKSIEITAQKQIIDPIKDSTLFRVQFSSKLPFEIAEASAGQTASLIAFLNRYLELPGFEMSEIEDQLHYRYVLLVNEAGFSNELVLGIIGSILMSLDLYSRSLESVASGKMSYSQLIEQALKVTQKV